MMTLSTHVLDIATGMPAAGVPVTVSRLVAGSWQQGEQAVTDSDGRAVGLAPSEDWSPGRWRIVFDIAAYAGAEAFFPSVTLEFEVADGGHYHVPLLLSPFGYTTYRGS